MSQSHPHLVRTIGRWSLTALTINSILGSGVFGLPANVAGYTGQWSPVAVLLAGVMAAIIMACFAEVASRFSEAGGPYLYTRAAFGPFLAIQVGWMLLVGQAAALAANANLFVRYLAEFWPDATQPGSRVIILTLLIGFLALVNFVGVKAGTELSNILTVAKLLPIVGVIIVGTAYLLTRLPVPLNTAPVAVSGWLQSLLILVFVYGGYETALAPMSEARNPRRDVAFALMIALIACTIIYTLIQWIVVRALPNAAASTRPLADVARLAVGSWAASIVSIGALVSLYGYLSAKLLSMPRVLFALAEHGDFPLLLGRIHARFHTPYISILVFALVTWALALIHGFIGNVTVSSVARLFYYAAVCAALPVLRKKEAGEAFFSLPIGRTISALGVLLCIALVTQSDWASSGIMVATAAVAFLNWLWVRNHQRS